MKTRILAITRTVAMLACAASCIAWGQTEAEFFDDTVLHDIRITINPTDWRRLQENFLDNTYYPANFTWRGITVENVGIRSKGRTSRRAAKPGLRVDMDRFEEQEFLGMKSFLLDNNISDFSLMKEKLAMGLFAQMGLTAPKEAYTRVFINGVYQGCYVLVESTDKRYLKKWFNENDGFLYEYVYAEGFRFEYRGADPALYSPKFFKPETNESNPNPRPIEAMIRTMNQASDADFARAMAEYIDLKRFLTHMAVESYVAEFDGILSDAGMNNYYMYRFERKNLSEILPKDKDLAFTAIDYPFFKNVQENVLMRRALKVPELRDHFLAELGRVASISGIEGGWMDTEIERIYNQIRDAMLQDRNKECTEGPCPLERSNEEFERTVAWMRQFAKERPEQLLLQLPSAP